MSFDPTRDYIKQRGIGSGIKFIQDGVVYNAGYVEIGRVKGYTAAHKEPDAETTKAVAAKISNKPVAGTKTVAGDVLANAAAKLNAGGVDMPVVPKAITEARRENAAAAAAEEHAV